MGSGLHNQGGKSLGAYDQFKKVTNKRTGLNRAGSRGSQNVHRDHHERPRDSRQNEIGQSTGTVEESFISRIEPVKLFFRGQTVGP